MRFELTTPTLARLCSTPELRPHFQCQRCVLCLINAALARRNHAGLRGRHNGGFAGVGKTGQKPHVREERNRTWKSHLKPRQRRRRTPLLM